MVSAVLFQTKADHAYFYLRQEIARGALPAGEPINQEELARTMAISVTPLREALRRLAAEGFIVLAAHRDARVAPLSDEEAQHLREMRVPLESLAAGLAASRITAGQRTELQALADELEPLGEHATERALDAHRAFHAAIWEAAHNPPLTSTLALLWDRADRYRRHTLSEIRGTGTTRTADFEQHYELRDLIVAGDSPGASDLMRRHVEESLPSRGVAAAEEVS
ncbi:GntR family transcriptional regulator [Solirubrobacter taibaiensis]|nr:GntR family transcriptional regulator [Solirubrobacter taibaiensis]